MPQRRGATLSKLGPRRKFKIIFKNEFGFLKCLVLHSDRVSRFEFHDLQENNYFERHLPPPSQPKAVVTYTIMETLDRHRLYSHGCVDDHGQEGQGWQCCVSAS